MILSDPSFEGPHCGKYYALYFKTGMSSVYGNNCDYKPIIWHFSIGTILYTLLVYVVLSHDQY